MNKYDFFPSICPCCSSELVIVDGVSDGVIKLFCVNKKCSGSHIKRLQKGISLLEMKGFGPATIKKLYEVGIRNTSDIFSKAKINSDTLIESGVFKKGKQLEKLLNILDTKKSINIDKAINSLQIEIEKHDGTGNISVGSSLSFQLGHLLSGTPYDFDGLSIQIRDDVFSENSKILSLIKDELQIFEDNGVKIILFEKKTKVVKQKSISKNICLSSASKDFEIPPNLNWNICSIIDDCNLLIVEDKNEEKNIVLLAKKLGIKVLTKKQVKMLFF